MNFSKGVEIRNLLICYYFINLRFRIYHNSCRCQQIIKIDVYTCNVNSNGKIALSSNYKFERLKTVLSNN